MRPLLLAVMVVGAVPALAQTVYSWEDADGVHYTDDPAQVPARATKRSEQKYERSPAPSTPQVTVAVAEQVEREKVAHAEAAKRREEADRQSEQAWRERFVTLNRNITSQKDLITRLKAALPASPFACAQPLSVGRRVVLPCNGNFEYERQTARIATEQAHLDDLERQLEQLDREASYAAVPREWRRGF
jgi:hypothetical protein